MRRIRIRHLTTRIRHVRRHRTRVRVLTRHRRPRRRVGPHLTRIQQPVTVVTRRTGDRHPLIIRHHHVRQIHVTGVRHHVGPRHRITHRHHRPRSRIGIHTVGRLLDVDRRIGDLGEGRTQGDDAVDAVARRPHGRGVLGEDGGGRRRQMDERVDGGGEQILIAGQVGQERRRVDGAAAVGDLDPVLLLVLALAPLGDVIVVGGEGEPVVTGGDARREGSLRPVGMAVEQQPGEPVGDPHAHHVIAPEGTEQRPGVPGVVRGLHDLLVGIEGRGGRGVGVLPRGARVPEGDPGGGEHPRLAGIEDPVVVRVSALVDGSRRRIRGRDAIDDREARQRDGSRVRHGVAPRHGVGHVDR